MSITELQAIGLSRMDDSDIAQFLSTRRAGVLALPGDEVPYVVPMSYGFDGTSTLYFSYVLGTDSEKERLTESAERARFLVYRVDSAFHWQSVVVTGTLQAVPPDELENATLDESWRPELFENADLSRGTKVYRLGIEDAVGVRHTGLPPGFEE